MNDASQRGSAASALARDRSLQKIKDETVAIEAQTEAQRRLNSAQSGASGASTGEPSLQDLDRERQAQDLLNRSRQRGFFTPQQDYAYRQQELTQWTQYWKAAWGGAATEQQHLQDMSQEKQAWDQQTQSIRDRDSALGSLTTTQLASTNAQTSGANKSVSQLGGPVSGGPSVVPASQQNQTTKDTIQQVLGNADPVSNQTSKDTIQQVLAGQGPSDQTTKDTIQQVLAGTGAKDTTTKDLISQVLVGQGAKDTATKDMIQQVLVGKGPTDTTTKDTIKEAIDPTSRALVLASSADMGNQAGAGFASSFTGKTKSGLSKAMDGPAEDLKDTSKKAGDDSGSGFMGNFGSKLLVGIGPVILGMSAKMALIVPLVGAALATLPALAGIIGTAMGVGMIAGLVAIVAKESPALKSQFTAIGTDAKSALATIGAPIIPALSAVLKQVPALIQSVVAPLTGVMKAVAPQIEGVFNGLKPIITGLVGIMQAAAPAFGPVLEGLEALISSILPGIKTVIGAMIPFLTQFAGIFVDLGKNLGAFFQDAAPAIGASMIVLKALLDVVGGLLPALMKIGAAFAVALAPALVSFAGVIRTLTPTLVLLGGIVASLAQAIFQDLASAFGALAVLLKAIGPSLSIFGAALSNVFKVLENTGAFAEMGNALEKLAGPLGDLINALVTKLAPVLPILVTALSTFVGVLTQLATLGLEGVAIALSAIVKAIPAPVLDGIVIAILAVVTGFKAWALITGIVKGAEAAIVTFGNSSVLAAARTAFAWVSAQVPIVASFVAQAAAATAAFVMENLATLGIIAAIGLLVAAIVYLSTHWKQVWGDIENWAGDAYKFLHNLLSDQLVKDILAVWSLGLIPLAEHWQDIWKGILATVSWIIGIFDTIKSYVTTNFDNWWKSNGDAIKSIWNALWGAILSTFHALWDPLVDAIKIGWSVIQTIFTVGSGVIKVAWNALWTAITSAAKVGWAVITVLFQAGMVVIKAVWDTLWAGIEVVLNAAWAVIKTSVTVGWAVVTAVFQAGVTVVTTIWNALWAVATAVLKVFWAGTELVMKVAWDTIVAIFTVAINLLTGHWQAAWDAIKSYCTQVVNAIETFLSAAWKAVIGAVDSLFVNPFKTAFSDVLNWVRNDFIDPIENLFTQTLPNAFRTAVTAIGDAWKGVQNAIQTPVQWVLNHTIGKLDETINTVAGWVGLHPNLPTSFSFASGGAAGRRIPGYAPNTDSELAKVSPGEYILTPEAAAGIGYHNLDSANKYYSGRTPARSSGGGFASGGALGWFEDLGKDGLSMVEGLFSKAGDVAKILTALATGNTTAATNAFEALLPKGVGGAVAGLGSALTAMPPKIVAAAVSKLMTLVEAYAEGKLGSGEAIAAFAKSFLGKIPYVWGGTSLDASGADCSGFTQSVYAHFGIDAPRTSETQSAWAKKVSPSGGGSGASKFGSGSPGSETGYPPGALAFYHSPPGGPDPGHVAIVSDTPGYVVSQGGGMGPQWMPIGAMPLLSVGIPPNGFPASGTGSLQAGATPGSMTPAQIESLWIADGGNSGAAANMAAIAFAESGDVPGVVQSGVPAAVTGYGLYQITPTSGISQNGQFGDLLNASNNTKAAISLFNVQGYGPWTSDPVGGALVGSGLSYASGGVVPISPDWTNASGALLTSVQSEITAMQTMNHAALPATPSSMKKPPKGSTAAQRAAYDANQKAIAASPNWYHRAMYKNWIHDLEEQQGTTFGYTTGSGTGKPVGTYGAYSYLHHNDPTPKSDTTRQWNVFADALRTMTNEEAGPGIPGGYDPKGSSGWPAWNWLNPQWTSLRNSLLDTKTKLVFAEDTWNNIYGPNPKSATPGGVPLGNRVGTPATYTAADIMGMLDPSATVARPSFAAGGLLSGIDTMDRATTAPPRGISVAGQSTAGGSKGFNVENINVYNPIQETAGDSLTRSVTKLALTAGR